jgi:hypothetical protein
MKSAIFWDFTQCGCCKNRRFRERITPTPPHHPTQLNVECPLHSPTSNPRPNVRYTVPRPTLSRIAHSDASFLILLDFLRSARQLLVTANTVSSSVIFFTLMM